MVLFYTSTAVDPPVTIYMGKDKVENEDLIKYGTERDVWFHVDKLSSAHVYLRLPEGMVWEEIPAALLADCGQLVKANSIQGNKLNDQTVIYTPWDNLKKSGDMAVGQVSFHQPKKVKRVHVPARENAIVNRLNKTKVEREVDHEAERQARLKAEGQVRKNAALEKKKQEAELAKKRAEEKQSKSYDALFTEEAGYGVDKEGYDPEEDFM
ncbi:cytoplasmic protein [Calocera cornea HHB12733]|uniref:Cytoplasmic protein n=1 Tax=Calocera cornea HHB12733 TaxID=1353952 RepID=A0A165HJA8_9BASI|nr:cytoplasmic protein [Calocera cornea HHB12733]